MAVRIHWHRHPGCGTKHNTACDEMPGGRASERSCTMARDIPGKKGEYGCVHVEREGSAGAQTAAPSAVSEHAYVNADGDQVSVSTWSDGSTMTICENGTTTIETPEGARESVNDPLHGSPIMVSITPDGARTTEFPNGKVEVVQPDGATAVTEPDGTATTVHPDGQVTREGDGPSGSGVTLDEAVRRGHLKDVQLVSTGENIGPVAVLQGTCDGGVPFVYVPAGIITPADPVTNQTLDTHPTVVDTGNAGPIEVEIPGACRNDPALPPAPSGDTGISLDPVPPGDPTAHIPAIVDGVLQEGTVPVDLVATREDTARTLDQVTRWLRNDATPQQLVAFLIPRIPGSPEDKQQKAEEIVEWGSRLVDKTKNLDKQLMQAPEVPEAMSGPDTVAATQDDETAQGKELGYCFSNPDCKRPLVSAQMVTRDQCQTAGGESWRGTKSGCVNL